MKFSLVTATFNSAKTIELNVQSVLHQCYTDFEHIIVDNLSSDGTLEIVRKLYGNSERLKIISEKDSGISDAFNKGILAAAGDIILILSSDDYLHSPDTLQRVSEAFDDGIDVVHGNVFYIDEKFGNHVRRPLQCPIWKAMPFNHPATFYRKSVFDKYGLFDLKYRFAMDYEHTARFWRSQEDTDCKVKYLPETLVALRGGGASYTNERKSILETKEFLVRLNLWDSQAQSNYLVRLLRSQLKGWLISLQMDFIVTLWRQRKWK